MRANSVVAIISHERQSELVAALHGRNAGHLARVMRKDRGDIVAQLDRAGVNMTAAPDAIDVAERVLLVTAAHRSTEIGWLLLQRGATSVWVVSPEDGWMPMDDMPIDVAATATLPAQPVPSAHRSSRTFRPSKSKLRRRSRHVPAEPPGRPSGSSGT